MSASKRLITDNTGQNIAAALEVIAGQKYSDFLTDWNAIGMLCGAGNASKAFNIGDLISEPWTDTVTNVSYDNPWRVNHFSDEEDQSGNTVSGMWLQTKYTHPFGVQFSHQRAFYACPDGLSAGTYYITLGASWGNNAVSGNSYYFTLTQDVEAGGRLAGFYGMPDQSSSNWKVYSYGADGITLNETVSVTQGTTGTNLGTLALSTRSGNLNSMQETAYGHNRWSVSALRQYLNSSETKGNWWTPQDEWDIAPDQLATKDGFLCGMDEEMLANIMPVKTTTYVNTVNDGGGADVTYDKIIIPSLEQMYITPQISGEGDPQEYWQLLNGTSTKWAQYGTYEILKQYSVSNKTSSRYCRLRSADRGNAYYTWSVNSSGYVSYNHASYAYAFEPLAFIHR